MSNAYTVLATPQKHSGQKFTSVDSLAAMRRYSHAPSIASSNYSSTKDFKSTDGTRHSTRQFGRSTKREHDGEMGLLRSLLLDICCFTRERIGSHYSADRITQDQSGCREVVAKAPAVFPPCIAACIPTLLKACDDTAITNSRLSGIALSILTRGRNEKCQTIMKGG